MPMPSQCNRLQVQHTSRFCSTIGMSRLWFGYALRGISTRFAPDRDRVGEFARRISAAKKLALIYGQEIDRSGGWNAGVAFAEKLNAPVFHAPNTERPSFPETHRLFQGMLPIAIGPLSERLKGFELAVVIGAPVFRYYPYIQGPVLPPGCELLQITNDPADAASALVGDSILGDAKLTLEALLDMVEGGSSRTAPAPLNIPRTLPSPPNSPLTASEAYAALSELRLEDAIVVQELPVEPDGLISLVAHYQTGFNTTPTPAAGLAGMRRQPWASRSPRRIWAPGGRSSP